VVDLSGFALAVPIVFLAVFAVFCLVVMSTTSFSVVALFFSVALVAADLVWFRKSKGGVL
jgi:hypothetical protein